ncbi:MAG: hypothetical protein NBKEAIPA_01112 [Nitrospirae bacterium]|nr:MAG: hypothetical protein UZ03_NOB001002530 [Nitrospira sp. OLB3]MBV6469223.1 hypothetical protein [Nitrospirota bacterium]MCE7964812.1 hypothetical protein [Nitrospira sp. NTP2]MCK6492562.1 hypothetical protein [Nitrospira sp.]MEB2337768.1 hypothetical protein [Nitrospirales bacterium]
MATLNQILAEQTKLIGEAKSSLEAALKKPPTQAATIAAREATVAELKTRVANLTEAKATFNKQVDQQLAGYQVEISTLEKLIEEDKKRVGDQPTPPRPVRGKGRGK